MPSFYRQLNSRKFKEIQYSANYYSDLCSDVLSHALNELGQNLVGFTSEGGGGEGLLNPGRPNAIFEMLPGTEFESRFCFTVFGSVVAVTK
jgi:hypothetical protein